MTIRYGFKLEKYFQGDFLTCDPTSRVEDHV